MAEKDFRVQRGLIVADGDVNVPSDHSVFAGTFDTNVAAAAVTLSGTTLAADGTDTNINISLTPKGTGSLLATRINNTVIGNVTPAAATVTSLTATLASTLRGAITTGDTTVDTTITQANSEADAAGRSLTIKSGSPPTGDTADTGTGGNLVLAAGSGKGSAAGGSILFQVADGAGSSTNLNSLATALTIADDKSFTFGGAVDFNNQALTNVDINSGAIDGTTIGAATPSTIAGTSLTIDDVAIDGKVITMTGDTNDTVTMTAAAAGKLTIATTDNSGFGGNIVMNADGNINLNTANTGNSGADARINFKYNGNTKVAVKSGAVATNPVLDVTGNVQISGSILGAGGSAAGVTNIKASGYVQSGHADLMQTDGILGLDAQKSSIVEINGSNFYTSETLNITVASNQNVTPGGTYYSSGNFAGQGVIKVMVLNTANTGSTEIYQAAETLAVFTNRDNTSTGNGPVIQNRVVQKLIGHVNPAGGMESTVIYESSSDEALGHFEWVREADAFGTGQHGLALIWVFTKPVTMVQGVIQISCNVNGLSLQGAGG